MKRCRHTSIFFVAFFALSGSCLTATRCLGFGGVSVSAGGVGISAGPGGVSAGVGVGGTGTAGVSAGVTAGPTGTAAGTNVTGAMSVSVGVSGVAGGASAGAAISDGGSAAVSAGMNGTPLSSAVTAGTSAVPVAAPRSALQMGVGPFVPDRGMAQALGYDKAVAAAVAASVAADRVFRRTISALPPLPSINSGDQMVSNQLPSQTGRQQPQAAIPRLAREVPAPLLRPSHLSSGAKDKTKTATTVEHANPVLARQLGAIVKALAANAVTAGDPLGSSSAPRRSLRVLLDPPRELSSVRHSRATSDWQDGWRGEPEADWNMVARFSDFRASPFHTRLAALIVTVLSALSAYGWVRLMSEKCPRCVALLQRHSAGCRSCGAVFSPDYRGRA
jgi:hypothetical protein